MTPDPALPDVLGAELPLGTRFAGPLEGAIPGWGPGDAPDPVDLDTCVACGLCLPHCPTYRLTGEESASPRGRIAAMRAVSEGRAEIDDAFGEAMDLCLVCRACEDICPSHAPFGRMMEAARAQIEPRRGRWDRALRRAGLDFLLPNPKLLWLAAVVQPAVTWALPRRIRAIAPRPSERLRRLPRVTEPPAGVATRGTVALLRGCVQDRWFREVNRATIRVLARNGWRVEVPRDQRCCGALQAHNGRLDTARRLAARNVEAFAGVDHVIVNAAGCGAHMTTYGELTEGRELPVRDAIAFLDEEGFERPVRGLGPLRVAYHDACHALRAQLIHDEPRRVLATIPGLEVVEIANGDRCCGAAGLYALTEPELSGRLRDEKALAIHRTGAEALASANPGCTMQLHAGLRSLGDDVEIVHPIQLLDRAYHPEGTR
ncbi:MAG: (Fe-S)-binding protein [Actinomycetota bacterium]